MKYKSLLGQLALLTTALIWGFAFVAQKSGMDHIGPLEFTAIRSFLGGIFLIPVIAVLDKCNHRQLSLSGSCKGNGRTLILGGISCGTALCFATLLQQWGIMFSTAGKAGFYTALYIVIVPFLGIFAGKKAGLKLWTAVLFALAGTYMLSSPDGAFQFQMADFLLIACAFVFSLHILVIDYFAPKTDCVRMSCLQFFTAGFIALILSFFCGKPWRMEDILNAAVPLLYCGFCSSGIAYTLQIIGQKYIHPARASLIMSLESVFSALGGWLLLNEHLSGMELCGCIIIFTAVILVQLPMPGEKKKIGVWFI